MALSNIGANPAQHVVRALIGAGVMAALCAVAWSFIAARADDHSTWLALLTGLLVGLSVRRFGKALGDWFGLIAVAGTMASIALAGLINRIGLTWLPPGRVEPIELALRVASEPGMLAFSAVWLVVVGVLSALLPATRAARMNIVEALRHV